MDRVTLKAGTLLYHGTDCDDFEEKADSLDGPAWLTSSRSVAERFASRSGGWGGQKRVLVYRLTEDVELPEILSSRGMQELADEHNLDLNGVEAMRESVANAQLPGWIIPNNYPDGDDILLVNSGSLDYVETLSLQLLARLHP